MRTFPLSIISIFLVAACGNYAPQTTLASHDRSDRITIEDGEVTVRILQNNSISIHLKDESPVGLIFNGMTRIKGVIEGEDGDYLLTKRGKDIVCGGSTTDSRGNFLSIDDPDCLIEINPFGNAVLDKSNPWAWAEAKIKVTGHYTVVEQGSKISVLIEDSQVSRLIYESLSKVKEQIKHIEEASADTGKKVGSSIRCDYDGTDGDDFSCSFQVDERGNAFPKR